MLTFYKVAFTSSLGHFGYRAKERPVTYSLTSTVSVTHNLDWRCCTNWIP